MLKQLFLMIVKIPKKLKIEIKKENLLRFVIILGMMVATSLILNSIWFLLYFALFNRLYNYLNGLLRWGIVVFLIEVVSLVFDWYKNGLKIARYDHKEQGDKKDE